MPSFWVITIQAVLEAAGFVRVGHRARREAKRPGDQEGSGAPSPTQHDPCRNQQAEADIVAERSEADLMLASSGTMHIERAAGRRSRGQAPAQRMHRPRL